MDNVQNYREIESSSESSDSSDSEYESFFNNMHKSLPKLNPVKTKGEVLINDLPPIEYLRITVPEDELEKLGKITSIVDNLVVIQALENLSALDEGSVLFLTSKEPLGKIFEIFGLVSRPYYTVRFNSNEDVIEKGIVPSTDVFYAPKKDDLAHYVFTEPLRMVKGSDASWVNNNEPPEEFIDYSDDEKEKAAKQKKKNRRRPCEDDDVTLIPPKKKDIKQNLKGSSHWHNDSTNNDEKPLIQTFNTRKNMSSSYQPDSSRIMKSPYIPKAFSQSFTPAFENCQSYRSAPPSPAPSSRWSFSQPSPASSQFAPSLSCQSSSQFALPSPSPQFALPPPHPSTSPQFALAPPLPPPSPVPSHWSFSQPSLESSPQFAPSLSYQPSSQFALPSPHPSPSPQFSLPPPRPSSSHQFALSSPRPSPSPQFAFPSFGVPVTNVRPPSTTGLIDNSQNVESLQQQYLFQSSTTQKLLSQPPTNHNIRPSVHGYNQADVFSQCPSIRPVSPTMHPNIMVPDQFSPSISSVRQENSNIHFNQLSNMFSTSAINSSHSLPPTSVRNPPPMFRFSASTVPQNMMPGSIAPSTVHSRMHPPLPRYPL
ncbi:hypothetical protein NPIL_488041 [Nephila pilipes]|uniref:H/ACA ribonucleoprotein complex non-core subunit NAF1 n=1 Tax=Nephila pilipes TaxID=299642 RepID=A0A8X6P1H3_NEPPI|nr:hypothetical protein NPIL_488041 [Nephila pilipes]